MLQHGRVVADAMPAPSATRRRTAGASCTTGMAAALPCTARSPRWTAPRACCWRPSALSCATRASGASWWWRPGWAPLIAWACMGMRVSACLVAGLRERMQPCRAVRSRALVRLLHCCTPPAGRVPRARPSYQPGHVCCSLCLGGSKSPGKCHAPSLSPSTCMPASAPR